MQAHHSRLQLAAVARAECEASAALQASGSMVATRVHGGKPRNSCPQLQRCAVERNVKGHELPFANVFPSPQHFQQVDVPCIW
jgi:hypothetical protein